MLLAALPVLPAQSHPFIAQVVKVKETLQESLVPYIRHATVSFLMSKLTTPVSIQVALSSIPNARPAPSISLDSKSDSAKLALTTGSCLKKNAYVNPASTKDQMAIVWHVRVVAKSALVLLPPANAPPTPSLTPKEVAHADRDL